MTPKTTWLIRQVLTYFEKYPDSKHYEFLKFYKTKSEIWDSEHTVKAYEIPPYYITAGKIPANGH